MAGVNTGSVPTDLPFDEQENRKRIAALRRAGVLVWSAERVFVGPEVQLSGIEPGAILMNAVIRGTDTIVGAGSQIGTSGAAFIRSSQIGRSVELGAGIYNCATLFDRVKVRGFAEIRQGTVLEEDSEIGHNVGLKHTFFTSGVVAGSCINFCDVLVTGGSSREDHSEIGSGAMHFNFDPRRDKFGSLLGDVRGVLLRKSPIFIGGNGGVIAPVHIGFGGVVAAGVSVRRDVGEGQICWGETGNADMEGAKRFDPNVYHDLKRKFLSTATLCGNLHALEIWYRSVRAQYSTGLDRVLCESAIRNIRLHLHHRAKEVQKVVGKLCRSETGLGPPNAFLAQHLRIAEMSEEIFDLLAHPSPRTASAPQSFLEEYERAREALDHCDAVRALGDLSRSLAEDWLSAIAEEPRMQLQSLLEI